MTASPDWSLFVSDIGLVGRFSAALRMSLQRSSEATSPVQGRKDDKASSATLMFRRARFMARAGDTAMAARLYADAAALEPTLAEAFEACGELLDQMGHRVLAAEQYALARNVHARLRPGTPDRHFVLRQRGQFVAEIMAYDTVLRSLKKNALPHLARGNAYLASGRPDKALLDYDGALRLKPTLSEISALRGEALSMLGRYDEALQAFNLALAGASNEAETLSGRAIAWIALGRLDEANADWRRQLDLLSGSAAARACVALRLADYKTGLADLESALVKEPADPYWHLYRLAAQARLGVPLETHPMPQPEDWPGPLLALYRGGMSEEEVLTRADNDCRRAEAHFQLGVMVSGRDRTSAERHWRTVVECAAPHMIEHAAARNELSHPGA
jgi:tetratricopeptide (TPR) repeat protein